MRYRATLAYSGEHYAGFQRQKNKVTVQGTLEKTLSFLLGKETTVKGAGRTDAGVHARGQVFSFDADAIKDVSKFRHAFNRLLPEDIFIRDIQVVGENFDSRLHCRGKVYEYCFTIHDRDPLRVHKIAQLRRDDFEFDGFLRGLSEFEGEHCFQNFTTKPEDNKGFVRNVHIVLADLLEDGNFVRVVLRGDGFMRYQIRMMVGAAIRVGLHRLAPEDIRASLQAKTRKILPYKAPAEGLCLLEVLYEDDAAL
ncbi:MAG: tRNA pseudouridine(38-40) synthase TruA [Bacilli bacterium]|nr:tRNA pseudouridine(38-40) synthase TruA [Bacilli bacterium]